MQGMTLVILRQEWRMAVIKKMNNRGPSVSPCLTPMELRKVLEESVMRKLTFTLECSLVNRRMIFGRTPDLCKTFQSSCLGTRSKTLTRSKKRIQVSWSCSTRFFSTILIEKTASVQDRPGRNPHCVSLSNFSAMGRSLACRMLAMIL